jgi:four helix bundle protein
MSDFKKLKVWRKAHALALNVHHAAARIRGPMYRSLRSQLVRSATSIPANIVEGRSKKTDADFARFLGYSVASTAELEYHLLVARDMGAITQATFLALLSKTIEVRAMLHGLINTLEGGGDSDSGST